MKRRISGLLASMLFMIACLFGGAQSLAQNAYIPGSDTVSVIATASNAVIATTPLPAGSGPSFGVAVTPDGSKVYSVNVRDNTVSAIATETNTVTATIPVGSNPVAFGVFIQPRFAGTPGKANCFGRSVAALARTFGGLNAAASALGFPSIWLCFSGRNYCATS